MHDATGQAPRGHSTAEAAARDLSWVFEHTAEGLLVLDTHARVTRANAAACEVLRQDESALAGMDFWELLPGEATAAHHQGANRALEAGRVYVFAHHQEFEGLWLEFHLAAAPQGIVVSVRDATAARESLRERRKAERERRKLFDANPGAMWVFDANTLCILAVNESALMF
ncbi:MAG: PAS domain-containing protein, partial [Burkholderiaceae bacterium]